MQIWMSQAEIEMIEKYLSPETIMLEYGSGGSTLYFSKFVKEYYSIEHDKKWYDEIKIKISDNDKIKTFLSEKIKLDPPSLGFSIGGLATIKKPSPIASITNLSARKTPAINTTFKRIRADCWDNLEKSTNYTIYKEYIKYPSIINKKFDAVLIDGRARPECAKFIYDFLNEGAYVFIHDYWSRNHYHVVREKYKLVEYLKGAKLAKNSHPDCTLFAKEQGLVVFQRKDALSRTLSLEELFPR